MRITSIQLQGFRNYDNADIRPCDGITVFTGDNAQGKTNILEAVYLSCTGRSHRTVHDKEMIKTNHDFAFVKVEARRNDGMHDVEIALNQMGRRKIKVAGNQVSRSGEMLGHITGVLFAPEDLRMVKDGPAERRRFVDMELSQLRPKYYYALQRYARALKQRGALLKEAAVNPASVSMIDMFDQQLAESGALIMDMRRDFIRKLSVKAGEVHAHVSGGLEKLSVEYCPSVVSDESGEKLQNSIYETFRRARNIDLKRMVTSIGPHRDDVRMNLNGMDVRAYGSQGQVRTCALSMKLSELAIMTEESGEAPVLMLDDVMSELDPGRRRMLLSMLSGVQTFVTCTDTLDLAGAECGKIFKVTKATLEEVEMR